MNKNPWILIVVLVLLVPANSYAQRWKLRRWEAGIGIGSTHFHGDVGRAHSDFTNFFVGARTNFGVDARFKINPSFAATLDLGYMWLAGKGVEGESHGYVYDFNTQGFEHTLRVEYYILGEQRGRTSSAIFNRRGMINQYNKIFLYLFTGAGGVMSKAKVTDQETGNEIIGIPGYNNNLLWTPVIPLGLGMKVNVNAYWSLGAEFGGRFLLGDYMDGYSDPTHSKFNDFYYQTSVKAIYKMRTSRRGWPVFRKGFR